MSNKRKKKLTKFVGVRLGEGELPGVPGGEDGPAVGGAVGLGRLQGGRGPHRAEAVGLVGKVVDGTRIILLGAQGRRLADVCAAGVAFGGG